MSSNSQPTPVPPTYERELQAYRNGRSDMVSVVIDIINAFRRDSDRPWREQLIAAIQERIS